MALIDEIREQPEVAARLLREAGPEIAAMCQTIRAADPAHVVIAARGTSDHAAIYAQYAFGVMAGISVGSRELVDRMHQKALELGGSDEGAPGLRAEGGDGFYAAYFRDLDGNKLDLFCYG